VRGICYLSCTKNGSFFLPSLFNAQLWRNLIKFLESAWDETYPAKTKRLALPYFIILTSTVFDWSPVWRTDGRAIAYSALIICCLTLETCKNAQKCTIVRHIFLGGSAPSLDPTLLAPAALVFTLSYTLFRTFRHLWFQQWWQWFAWCVCIDKNHLILVGYFSLTVLSYCMFSCIANCLSLDE